MRDYPRSFRNRLFRRCWLTVSGSLAITPALPVASLFSYRRRSIVLLRLPARPSPRRAPALVTAIALSRSLRTKTPLASFQQTTPRTRAPAWRLAGFPIFGRECRILVRAHGSVAPGSSCPGGDSTPLRGAAGSGSAQIQESIAEPGAAARVSRFLPPCGRGWSGRMPVKAARAFTAIESWRLGPIRRCHNGPFARRH